MNPITAKRHIQVTTPLTTDGVYPRTDDGGKQMTKTTVHPLSAKGHFERLNAKLPPALRHTITEKPGDRDGAFANSATGAGRTRGAAQKPAETGKRKSSNVNDGNIQNDDVLRDDTINKDGGLRAAAASNANSNAPEHDDVSNDENIVDDIQQHEIAGIHQDGGKGNATSKGAAPKKAATPRKSAAPKKAAAPKKGRK